MQNIYMNYASTSPVKPKAVTDAVEAYLNSEQINPGRNMEGLKETGYALDARLALAALLDASNPANIIFTSGATLALNMAINGLATQGCHIISTMVEHNAVARPLKRLEDIGIASITWLQCNPNGSLEPFEIEKAIKRNSRFLVMSHASNVLGTIMPVSECFNIAKKHGLTTVLDASQTIGLLPVSMHANTDVICFTGHKGLMGLAGTGGMALSQTAAEQMRPWICGGTGSNSHTLQQPENLPDKFEPGTQNTLGIIALGTAASVLQKTGIESIRTHEMHLTQSFIDGLKSLPVIIHGTGDAKESVSLVSISAPNIDCGVLSQKLYEQYGIITRSGLHCSPLAHKTAGTFPKGTLRFSFGRETTMEEIDFALQALGNLLSTHPS